MSTLTDRLAGGIKRRPPALSIKGWIIIPTLLALGALFVIDRLYNPERFRIEAVEVQGRFERVDAGRVRAEVAQAISGNYFSLSLPHIEARVAALPWVFSASVRRRWPATLVVEVVEVQPVAEWGAHHWLHFTGDLVARGAGNFSANSGAKPAQELPRLSGPDERQETVWRAFQHWSEVFAGRGLRLDELRLDARGLWHLQLSLGALSAGREVAQNAPAETTTETPETTMSASPVALIVTQENAEARIAQFVEALAQSLMAEFPAMRTIDLRHPNGFAIGWKTESPPARRITENVAQNPPQNTTKNPTPTAVVTR